MASHLDDVPCAVTASVPEALRQAQDEIAELFGNIASFWGFTRTQGRIYGLTFLSPDPLAHGEIRDRLGISAGSASMTLASLCHWGVLSRRGRHYEAQTDMWKLITGVLRSRERDQVNAAIARLGSVIDILDHRDRNDQTLAFARERAEHLLEFFVMGRRFLDALVSQGPIHGLLATLAQQAAKFRPFVTGQHDASIGH